MITITINHDYYYSLVSMPFLFHLLKYLIKYCKHLPCGEYANELSLVSVYNKV
jgi:hypothetical protein